MYCISGVEGFGMELHPLISLANFLLSFAGRSHPIVQSQSAPRLQALAAPLQSQPDAPAPPAPDVVSAQPKSQPKPSDDIEQGEEALPTSIEAHAFQSLNESSQRQPPQSPRCSRSRSNSSHEAAAGGQDIPLQEISPQKKKFHIRDLFLPRRSQSSDGSRCRSSSYSPKRIRHRSSGESPGRSSPLQDKTTTPAWSQRSSPSASPVASTPPPEPTADACKASACPKTLTPAKAPAMSLVTSFDEPSTPCATLLMPPADEKRILSLNTEDAHLVPQVPNVTDDLKKSLQEN
ncbi:hypothetical protein CAPTEDRAFT_223469 [Capitella teleta]|uniref:Uncharacterized protein n=1 Tax=Capitella teleta TaxID=283909 RepID=R7V7A5_CAPTE|nr:hypothetical protein CAPTEDRAFT_223469 [Capitella teleta]|eukprot:ELU12251.1 hypothetical protein CAPTEDRAFT_223469 [Capitella teleta]